MQRMHFSASVRGILAVPYRGGVSSTNPFPIPERKARWHLLVLPTSLFFLLPLLGHPLTQQSQGITRHQLPARAEIELLYLLFLLLNHPLPFLSLVIGSISLARSVRFP